MISYSFKLYSVGALNPPETLTLWFRSSDVEVYDLSLEIWRMARALTSFRRSAAGGCAQQFRAIEWRRPVWLVVIYRRKLDHRSITCWRTMTQGTGHSGRVDNISGFNFTSSASCSSFVPPYWKTDARDTKRRLNWSSITHTTLFIFQGSTTIYNYSIRIRYGTEQCAEFTSCSAE